MLLFFSHFVSLSESLRTELSISFLVYPFFLVFLLFKAAECIRSVGDPHGHLCGEGAVGDGMRKKFFQSFASSFSPPCIFERSLNPSFNKNGNICLFHFIQACEGVGYNEVLV